MAGTAKPDPSPTKTPTPPAGRASESGDPTVQQLLAQRQGAAMNEDAALLAEVDAQLVGLGFTEYQH
jgi:hypothetical protein